MSVASNTTARRRLVVGISGSSAPHLGVRLLTALRGIEAVETHLVLSNGARLSIKHELDVDPDTVAELADVVHQPENLAASISSGSFRTLGMVVMPCSMRTLAAVASGNTADLLTRACDVTLKERRRLVLVTRETPLNLIHIRNMESVTLAGATVLPPMPAFYHRPKTIEDLLDQTVGKVLDQFDIEHDLFPTLVVTLELATRLANLTAGSIRVGDREQIMSLLTTGADGFPLSCALSRNEIEVDGDVVYVAVHARRTWANLERTGQATLLAIDDDTILSFRLSASHSSRHADTLATRFTITDCEVDTLHIPLAPATFLATSAIVEADRWKETKAALAALRSA